MSDAAPAALPAPSAERRLTVTQFHQLNSVPAEAKWFANLDNPRTRARLARLDRATIVAWVEITGMPNCGWQKPACLRY